MSLQSTPRANRLHVGIYGKVNSGKSTLLNALVNQESAVVSSQPGTTTDPVYKAMEWQGIGPIVWIDTAGFSDSSVLGEKRIKKTKEAAKQTDIALILCNEEEVSLEQEWIQYFQERKVPVILLLNKCDQITNVEALADRLEAKLKQRPICVSAKAKKGLEEVKEALLRVLPKDFEMDSITNTVCKENEMVLLVMPQDLQAPKGRLILPQVQTIRELLDKHCSVICTTVDTFTQTLSCLCRDPDLIICDSQVFKTVYEKKPKQSKLTSFSILFAGYKGDVSLFIEGAKAIDTLQEDSRVLIAEACTHAPLSEDIGREKIPALLRKRVGNKLHIDMVSGNDFPQDLTSYNLIIHCGACMFNRRYVLHRIQSAKKQGIPMTNYGIFLAHINGILEQIVY